MVLLVVYSARNTVHIIIRIHAIPPCTGEKDPSDSSICLSMLVICGNLRVGSMSTSSCIFNVCGRLLFGGYRVGRESGNKIFILVGLWQNSPMIFSVPPYRIGREIGDPLFEGVFTL